MQKFCLALDLINDEKLILEYEIYHHNVWPEIKESLIGSGILLLEIYRIENRLFMIMETSDHFTFERKAQMDIANSKVTEWEKLMWKYQQALPGSKPGEKWKLMKKIYDLHQ